MKFDVIVGNPPFSSGLWKIFIKKSISLSVDRVIMIAPDGVTQYSNSKKASNLKEFLISGGIQEVLPVTDYFPSVTSGELSAFFLEINKSGNESAFTKTGIQHNIVSKVLSKQGPKLHPILANQGTAHNQCEKSLVPCDMYTKVLSSVTAKGTSEYNWINNYKNKVINGNKYWFSNRFFGGSTAMALVDINEKISIGQNILAIEKIPGYTVGQFKEIYTSSLILFVLNIIKNGKFDTPLSAIKMLPIIPIGCDINAYFNLTQEEIDYINAAVPKKTFGKSYVKMKEIISQNT